MLPYRSGDSDIPQNNMTGFFNKVIRENAKQIFKMSQAMSLLLLMELKPAKI